MKELRRDIVSGVKEERSARGGGRKRERGLVVIAANEENKSKE